MNKFFKCKSAILFQTLSNITYTCAGWAENWVRGKTSAGPPWSGQKIGAFLCRELQNDNWCGINHTTPLSVEVNNSTVSQHGTTCFLPRQFSHGSRCCVSCSVAAPPSHPSSQQQPWGWAGHRKTTKCQSRSGGRMDGMVAREVLVQ